MTDHVMDSVGKTLESVAGGKARSIAIALLAATLAMSAADLRALSAVSGAVTRAYRIDNTQFGLILAVVSFFSAVGVLPMGVLVDRYPRKAKRTYPRDVATAAASADAISESRAQRARS